MSVIDEIERLAASQNAKSVDFLRQIERARSVRDALVKQTGVRLPAVSHGRDRSGDLFPVSRPSIVRTLTES